MLAVEMTKIFLSLIFIIFTFSLYSIEVGGHISEDTTWSPDNNPYIVIHNIFVDVGVTLNILPGTIIQVYSALALDDNSSDFYWIDGEAVAKMFWVNGKIIAEGTEQDSIIFTRYQDSEPNYRWGCIFFPEGSPESLFRYCKIMYSYENGVAIGDVKAGALCCWNGKIKVENCKFVNNYIGIWLENSTGPLLVYKNTFNNYSIYPTNRSPRFISLYNADGFFEHNLVVARNNFYNRGAVVWMSYPPYLVDYIFNHYENLGQELDRPIEEGARISYGNYAVNCNGYIIAGVSYSENDTTYVRKNTVIDCINYTAEDENLIGAGGYNAVVSDNYINSPGGIYVGGSISSKVYNNVIINAGYYRAIVTDGDNAEVYNNLVINTGCALKLEAENNYIHNNILHNNRYVLIHQDFPVTFENNIFMTTEGIIPNWYDENAIFRNNCLTFPLPDGVTDAGGNIFEDPLFADTLNGDFHLLPGSPCIDTGYDTTYTSTFDAEYFHRIIDGLGDGNAIIDMGAFEFGSSFIGGISGYVYKSENGEPLDIVKLKINGKPPEYSDSLGFFEFKLNEGTYNIQCSRFYYDDLTISGIEVLDGEITNIEIYMDETVSADNSKYSIVAIQLRNYPNPFNPETIISFSIPNENHVELIVYNIKGQKIKTLVNEFKPAGKHSVIWNGTDDSVKPVSSGIYFYKLKAGDFQKVKKMILIK